jgi:hypothetical protein
MYIGYYTLMVEGSKYTLDKNELDAELAKEKEWNKAMIANDQGEIITTRNLPTAPTKEEIQCVV